MLAATLSTCGRRRPPMVQAQALLLTGGLVIDGTGAPGRIADVLLGDGRIRAIGDGLDGVGARARDVTGRVVAPGFVDIHTHSDLTLLSDPRALSKVHQGVTTE